MSHYHHQHAQLGTRTGGAAVGGNLRPASYTPNRLDQYEGRAAPGAIPVTGLAAATATVTVNNFATYRKGEFYWKELTVANSSASVWQGITVKAVLGGVTNTTTGNVHVPKTPEVYGYDLDGNVTSDGRWNYTWDAENRLVRMISATTNGPQQRIDFAYDAGGRRIRKAVWNNTGGTGGAATDLAFLYDGWNVIAELNALSGKALLRSYIWGLDLSGSRQRAGGVGGLLGVRSGTVVHFATYDGKGNVAALVDGSTGIYSANYEYGPFGEVIRATGPLAKANPFRFSTKYQDDEADLLYYGYRYYSASTGRWPNRDPLGELGFELLRGRPASPLAGEPNRYLFVKNSPVNYFDPFGLDVWVIRDASGMIRHRWAVGNNADGTYWASDFAPTATSLIGRANCKGIINFTPNGIFNPTNLTSDFVVERHTVVSQTATDAARDYAKQRSNQADQPRYDACGNNCIDWANGLANFAIGRQIRENLDKIKNEKK